MNLDRIKEKLKKVPDAPGIYIFKNKKNKIIYVGKAASLKKRLASYFSKGKTGSYLIDYLIKEIDNFDYILADSPSEALILENQWIKQNQPKYNILLKDDKTYPYIKITIKDDFPRAFITRKIYKDGALYYGPFTPASKARRLLLMVYKFFKIRQCKIKIPGNERKVCMLYHIKRCSGPCEGLIDKNEYMNSVKEAKLFLEGKNDEVKEYLKKQMKFYADNLQFEIAADYRDSIVMLEEMDSKPKIFSDKLEDSDILGIYIDSNIVSVNIFQMRKGFIVGRKEYYFKDKVWENEEDLISGIIMQYYSNNFDVPNIIYIPKDFQEKKIIEEWFKKHRKISLKLIYPKSGLKNKLIEFANKNAKNTYYLTRKDSKEEDIALMEEIKNIFKLPTLPNRIEAIDISHIYGKFTVGALVVFDNLKFNKSEYRRYKLSNVKRINDYFCIKKVFERRIKRLLKEGKNLPDLVVIDGGKGQLNIIEKVIKKFKVNIPAISIAKENEEIYLPGRDSPVILQRNSEVLKVIQRIRDEAHRFAISYHKNLRSKFQKKSILDSIKGIGEKRKKLLLNYFKSVENLRKAPIEEVSKLVGKKLAEKIISYL